MWNQFLPDDGVVLLKVYCPGGNGDSEAGVMAYPLLSLTRKPDPRLLSSQMVSVEPGKVKRCFSGRHVICIYAVIRRAALGFSAANKSLREFVHDVLQGAKADAICRSPFLPFAPLVSQR